MIPPWKEENPHLLQNVKNTLCYLQQSSDLIDDYTALLYAYAVQKTEEGYRLDIAKIKRLPNVRAVLYALLNTFGFSAWEDIYYLLDAPSGKQVFRMITYC